MKPTFLCLTDSLTPDPAASWRCDDSELEAKLVASVKKFGQLRPVIVRGTIIVEGVRLWRALQVAGVEKCWVLECEASTDVEAIEIRVALDVRHRTDFAALAVAVSKVLVSGKSVEEVSAISAYNSERIAYFKKLSTFDWSEYKAGRTKQQHIDWSDKEESDKEEISLLLRPDDARSEIAEFENESQGVLF